MLSADELFIITKKKGEEEEEKRFNPMRSLIYLHIHLISISFYLFFYEIVCTFDIF